MKIDWISAIGGVVLGYYVRGKTESVKKHCKSIYTQAANSLKESLEESAVKQTPQGEAKA